MYIKKIITRLSELIGLDRSKKWQDIEYFDPWWKERIEPMAALLPESGTVVDFGCGKMWLREFIDEEKITYKGLDYTDRGEGTLVCDINQEPLPEIDFEVAFLSGFLEYVTDPKAFIVKLAEKVDIIVVSYCVTDRYPDIKSREEKTWKNHLSDAEIVKIFTDAGFKLEEKIDKSYYIYKFTK